MATGNGKLEEIRTMLQAEWGDRFRIDWLDDNAGAVFIRGMVDERGNYVSMHLQIPYADMAGDPAHLQDDLRRILSEDRHHTRWVKEPAPVQSISSEAWSKHVQRLVVAMNEEGIWNEPTCAFSLSSLFDAVIRALKGDEEKGAGDGDRNAT